MAELLLRAESTNQPTLEAYKGILETWTKDYSQEEYDKAIAEEAEEKAGQRNITRARVEEIILVKWQHEKVQESNMSNAELQALLDFKDRKGSYKRGMISVIMEDGHVWGSKEGLPWFYKIKIPGVSRAEIEKYNQREEDPNDNRIVLRRREWVIEVDNFIFDSKGEVEITKAELEANIRNLKTGLLASSVDN